MPDFRRIREDIMATGKVDSRHLEELRKLLYADGKIDRQEADFLAELHKRVQRPTPAFDAFFYKAIKDHILLDGRIDAEESTWLRQLIFADGKVSDEERKFMHQLKGEAKQVGPEFETLFKECMHQPMERHTSGG
jgi:hypothetical protein